MEYLHEDKKRFREAVDLTAYQTGAAPEAIEKDYFVTLILRLLSQKLSFIVFKGGTSLSKCYQLIKRFSEDIDITIDTSISQGQKKKLKEAIQNTAKELDLQILNLDETRSRRSYNRYVLAYETFLPAGATFLQPAVLIETSFTAISFPTALLPVHNMIGDMMETEAPDLVVPYQLEPFEMKVQNLTRTFIDKVFAICDYYLLGKEKKHSRHIYDIYKLLPLVSVDHNLPSLIPEVRKARSAAAICPSAQNGVSISWLLQKIMDEQVYKADYETLTVQLLEENISYNTAVTSLTDIIDMHIFE